MTTTNHRIWPGPERLRTRAHRLEKLAAEHGPFGALTRLGFLERVERAEFDRRSLGIAIALAATRARRERFHGWLLACNAPMGLRLLSASNRAMSPEAFVAALAESEFCEAELRWIAQRVHPGLLAIRPHDRTRLARALTKSNPWLSLPWQRESEGVGRG